MSDSVTLYREDYAALCALPTAIRKAWAMFVIDCWNSEGNSPEIPDPEVARLANEFRDNRIGTCDNCGKRAPLEREYMEPEWLTDVCAWGCT